MKKLFIMEWKRLCRSRRLYYALLLGCIFSILQVVLEEVPQCKFILGHAITLYPDSVFNNGLMFGFSKVMVTYYTIIILLAVIPYATTFYDDLQNGYMRQIVTREKIYNYLMVKYWITFLSAGIVSTVPLILNVILNMMIYPAVLPQPGTFTFVIGNMNLFADIFYTEPFLFVLIYILIVFLVIGSLSTIALSISWIAFNKYIVLFSPFIIFYLFHFICLYMNLAKYSLLAVIMPTKQLGCCSFQYILFMILGIFIITLLFFFIGGKRHEVI